MPFSITTFPIPQPPPPQVPRYDKDGKPTQAQIDYESKLNFWLIRLAASVP